MLIFLFVYDVMYDHSYQRMNRGVPMVKWGISSVIVIRVSIEQSAKLLLSIVASLYLQQLMQELVFHSFIHLFDSIPHAAA